MSPDRIDGIPVCRRHKCKCFHSGTQSGWGVYSECVKWNPDKYGKEHHFSITKKTVSDILPMPKGRRFSNEFKSL